MKIWYDDQADVLHIDFSNEPVIKDVSYGWNVNVSFCANGIAGITVLDAKANGYWPIENLKDLLATQSSDEVAVMQSKGFLQGAVARMSAAPSFFTEEERHALESYEGPVVSGDPKGNIPENLEEDNK